MSQLILLLLEQVVVCFMVFQMTFSQSYSFAPYELTPTYQRCLLSYSMEKSLSLPCDCVTLHPPRV